MDSADTNANQNADHQTNHNPDYNPSHNPGHNPDHQTDYQTQYQAAYRSDLESLLPQIAAKVFDDPAKLIPAKPQPPIDPRETPQFLEYRRLTDRRTIYLMICLGLGLLLLFDYQLLSMLGLPRNTVTKMTTTINLALLVIIAILGVKSILMGRAISRNYHAYREISSTHQTKFHPITDWEMRYTGAGLAKFEQQIFTRRLAEFLAQHQLPKLPIHIDSKNRRLEITDIPPLVLPDGVKHDDAAISATSGVAKSSFTTPIGDNSSNNSGNRLSNTGADNLAVIGPATKAVYEAALRAR